MLSKETLRIYNSILYFATIIKSIPFDWNPERTIIKLAPPINRKQLILAYLNLGIDIFVTISFAIGTIHFAITNEDSISETVPLFIYNIGFLISMTYSIGSHIYSKDILCLVNKLLQMNQFLRM